MIVLFLLLGFVAFGLAVGFLATGTAPEGFQDEAGFHYGPSHKKSEAAAGVSHPELARA